jgi:ferredoxin-NADP reductase
MMRTIPAGEAAGGILELYEIGAADSFLTNRVSQSVPFGESGALAPLGVPQAEDGIVCHCLQVSLETLRARMRAGATTQEDLARETGVTTVCGGCVPRVAELVGSGTGNLTHIIEVREILPTVRSFRFAPADPRQRLTPALPGQHVVVSALIDGVWVSRPYTLTEAAGERNVQEITVKLEPKGKVSRWLFRQKPGDFHQILVTPPRGGFHVDLGRSEPIVFFAGGIGITPAISALRTLRAEGGNCLIHIDYSARERQGFAFREELEAIARADSGISINFRATDRARRLNAEDVAMCRWRFPRGRYLICGPESYQQAVRRYLAKAGIDDRRIHVEVFTSAPRQTARASLTQVNRANTGARAVGLVLLTIYLAQGLFHWEWPWLTALQEVETYRRWSGAFLLLFIASQWALPVLRLRERLAAASVAYRWHRWIGSIAPVFFYLHASWVGFGYLLALGSVYLANVLVGLTDKSLIAQTTLRERYGRVWLPLHVALACLTVGLTLFHIVVVFAYR